MQCLCVVYCQLYTSSDLLTTGCRQFYRPNIHTTISVVPWCTVRNVSCLELEGNLLHCWQFWYFKVFLNTGRPQCWRHWSWRTGLQASVSWTGAVYRSSCRQDTHSNTWQMLTGIISWGSHTTYEAHNETDYWRFKGCSAANTHTITSI